ncbi:hypothetical protein BpHYR1_007253 [Brachionus plicatilis]|uniref:Uncharacterized protein n=1 Tax=Brachionus plicatilis TaxID=10195 RepID=A0A3M7T8D8_BRAPC|nr:hypothetical protein BpHYR1_007253 [Brachionus plicatilis]
MEFNKKIRFFILSLAIDKQDAKYSFSSFHKIGLHQNLNNLAILLFSLWIDRIFLIHINHLSSVFFDEHTQRKDKKNKNSWSKFVISFLSKLASRIYEIIIRDQKIFLQIDCFHFLKTELLLDPNFLKSNK